MPGKRFLARLAPEFAQHAGSARENAKRQADVERLIARAEYEVCQVRRALLAVLGSAEVPVASALPAAEAPTGATLTVKPARAA